MKVSIENIKWIHEQRAKINREPLENIEFYEQGKKIDMPEQLIEDFCFTGMNNVDFILTGFYTGPPNFIRSSEMEFKGHPRFYELIERMKEIHSSKNQDYAKEEDPLQNLCQCEKIGIPAHIGCFIRMQDKWSRITNLIKGQEPEVKDETVKDTLMDLAVYSLLCIILIEEDKEPFCARQQNGQGVE